MVNTLRVMLWDEEIGRLAWDNRRRLSYFTYNPEFLKKGIDISPLQAPVRGIREYIQNGTSEAPQKEERRD